RWEGDSEQEAGSCGHLGHADCPVQCNTDAEMLGTDSNSIELYNFWCSDDGHGVVVAQHRLAFGVAGQRVHLLLRQPDDRTKVAQPLVIRIRIDDGVDGVDFWLVGRDTGEIATHEFSLRVYVAGDRTEPSRSCLPLSTRRCSVTRTVANTPATSQTTSCTTPVTAMSEPMITPRRARTAACVGKNSPMVCSAAGIVDIKLVTS